MSTLCPTQTKFLSPEPRDNSWLGDKGSRVFLSWFRDFRFKDLQWERSFEQASMPAAPKKIVAVGHRGTRNFAPENTIAAHEAAYQMGARAIEFDVRSTRDGQFVLMHDKNVSRTTNGYGNVKDMTLREIQSLDAGSHKGLQFSNEKVPTLREALRNVRGRFAVDIDFKGGPSNSADMLERVLIEEGFTHADAPLTTIFARRHHFDILKPLSAQFALRPHYVSPSHVAKTAAQYPIQIMGLRRLSFSPKAAAAIRIKGLNLFSNVMGAYDNELGFEDARRAGSMFIQTDNLDLLIPYLKSRNLLETRVMGRSFQPL